MWRRMRRSRFEREMDDELAFHLRSRIEEHVRRGSTPDEAERRARLEFGGVDKHKEQVRDARPLALLDDLVRDLTYAWRSLRRTPVFAATAVLAIGLGVAVNAAWSAGLLAGPAAAAGQDPSTICNVFMSTRGGGSRGSYGTPTFVRCRVRLHAGAVRYRDLAGCRAPLSCTCRRRTAPRAARLRQPAAAHRRGRRSAGSSPPQKRRRRDPLRSSSSWSTWQQQFGAARDIAGRVVSLTGRRSRSSASRMRRRPAR
jgi:hypothetical protein